MLIFKYNFTYKTYQDSNTSQLERQTNNQMCGSYHTAASYEIFLRRIYKCINSVTQCTWKQIWTPNPAAYIICSKSQKSVFCSLHREKSSGYPDRVSKEKVKEQELEKEKEKKKWRKEIERQKHYLPFSSADDKGKIIIITQTIICLSCAVSPKSHP